MIKLINDTIDEKDIDRLVAWLKAYPRLTKGPITKEFEEKWAKWLGTKFAVFCNSGSSANLLMLHALLWHSNGLRNKKIVIPGLCWATDLAPAMQLGYEPILCDINLDNLSVDLKNLEEIFKTESPAVFLSVSVLGFSPDIAKILELCTKYNVLFLEDNCESLGTEYHGIKLGNFGMMSSYSLYFGHHISTIEGGMICTDSKQVYDILLSTRSHGWDRDWDKERQEIVRQQHKVSDFSSLYTFYYPGFNLRSTDLQAFIGLSQLDKLDGFIKGRNLNFLKYQKNLINTFWKPTTILQSFTSNFAYPIIHPKRDEIVKALQDNDIEVRPLICGTMGKQPFYVDKYGEKSLTNCDIVDQYGLYVPNHSGLSDDNLSLIIDTVNKITK